MYYLQGVDETFNATLKYSNGRVGNVYSSMRCDLPNEGVVVGTKGTIKVWYETLNLLEELNLLFEK